MMYRKHKKNLFLTLSIIIILSMLLTACGANNVEKIQKTKEEGPEDTVEEVSKVPKDAEIIIKFSQYDGLEGLIENTYPAYVQVFKRIVESSSDGRIAVEVYPNSQLGSLPSTLDQVHKGTIEMACGQNTGLFATYYPDIAVFDIPFAYDNLEIASEVCNSEFGQTMKKNVAEATGIRILSYLTTGFRNFGNNKKLIKEPEDLKGMKIRVMEGDIYVELMKSLGASPIVIAATELYSSLQTGVVDGQENSPYNVLSMKLEEVIDYYTLDGHLLNVSTVSMNEKFFQSLSEEDQKLILYAARTAEKSMVGTAMAKENDDLKKIAKAGVEIHQPTKEALSKFKDLTQEPIINVLKDKLDVDEKVINNMFEAINLAEKKYRGIEY